METEQWRNQLGEQFHFVHFRGIAPCENTLLLIHHGHGEHIRRYDGLATRLSQMPIDVRGFDCRGHGLSVGGQGCAENLDELVTDLETVIDAMMEKSGATQLIIFAHSMGAAVLCHYLANRIPHAALSGVILSAAALHFPRTPIVNIKLFAARFLRRLAPTLTMETGLDPSGISTVPEEVQRYKNDPLIHGKLTSGFGLSLVNHGNGISTTAPRITTPLLVYHGTADPICGIQGSRQLVKHATNAQVDYHEFEGYYHELHHESQDDAGRVFDLIVEWLTPKLTQNAK